MSGEEQVSGLKVTGAGEWTNHSRWLYETTRQLVSLIVVTRLIRAETRGEERIPSRGPVIVMVNHQSNLDPLFIGWAMRRPMNIPGKVELFRVPILRTVVTALGCFPVNREGTDARSLRHSLTVLRAGRLLLVFPEGTRSRTGEVNIFNPTLTRLALRENVPVIPAAVNGTGALLPPGRRIPRFGARVIVNFGDVLRLRPTDAPKPSDAEVAEATETIRRAVLGLFAQSQL